MTIVSVDWVGSRQAMAVGEKLLNRQFLVGNAYCHKLTFFAQALEFVIVRIGALIK